MEFEQSAKFGNFYFNNNYTIYLDMDGVLCDFNLSFQKLTNYQCKTPRVYELTFGRDEFYKVVKEAGKSFWSNMDWMPDGKLIWNYLEKYHPIILSKPMDFQECYDGKEEWIVNNLGPATPFVITKEKEFYADEKAILIDDMPPNVQAFRLKGGIAILHKNSFKTISILKKRYKL